MEFSHKFTMAVVLLATCIALFTSIDAAMPSYPSPSPSPSPYPSPNMNCICSSANDPHVTGFYPVVKVFPQLPLSPFHQASVTFFPNNDHEGGDMNNPPPQPQVVNLTLDSSCNQIILPRDDCYRLRLPDSCQDRSITCNSTWGTCKLGINVPVFPAQIHPMLLVNSSFPLGDPNNNNNGDGMQVLCADGIGSGHGTAGIAPYRLSFVVQLYDQLGKFDPSLNNMAKVFGYCLGNPKGYFFIGRPVYSFVNAPGPLMLHNIPTLRWDEDVLPVIGLTGMAIYSGDDFSAVAPVDPSTFSAGLKIDTGSRYLSLVEPAYQWLKNTMASMAQNSSLQPAPSPYTELELCFTLAPNMTIDVQDQGPPKLVLQLLGNQTWTINAVNFLVVHQENNGERTVCLGAVNAGPDGVSSIGTLQQEEVMVEYDFERQNVGVSDNLGLVGASCGELLYPD